MKKLKIEIDISDWRDKAMKDESLITSETDLIQSIDEGRPTFRAAQDLIVSQEMGLVENRITRPNKALIVSGAALDIALFLKKKREMVRVNSGVEFPVHVYRGRLGRLPGSKNGQEEPSEDQSYAYIKTRSEIGLKNIVNYLEKRVPGDIWNCLIGAYSNGADVVSLAETLKSTIDQMVTKITETQPQ